MECCFPAVLRSKPRAQEVTLPLWNRWGNGVHQMPLGAMGPLLQWNRWEQWGTPDALLWALCLIRHVPYTHRDIVWWFE